MLIRLEPRGPLRSIQRDTHQASSSRHGRMAESIGRVRDPDDNEARFDCDLDPVPEYINL